MFVLKSRYSSLVKEVLELRNDKKALQSKIDSLEEKVASLEREAMSFVTTSSEFDITEDDLVSGKQFFCLGYGKRTFVDLDGQLSLLDNKSKSPVGIGWVKTIDEVLRYMKEKGYRNIKE